MKLTAKLTGEIHAALFYSNRIDKRRWAYKVAPSEWDQLSDELRRASYAQNFLRGWSCDPPTAWSMQILGVDIITDCSLEPLDVLKDYGISG